MQRDHVLQGVAGIQREYVTLAEAVLGQAACSALDGVAELT